LQLTEPARVETAPLAEELPDSVREFENDRLGFLLDAARRDGEFARFRVRNKPSALITDPTLVEEVMVGGKAGQFSKDYLSDLIPALFRRNLLLDRPDSWLAERRMAQPAFHHDRLVTYARVMAEEAEKLTETWRDGEEVELAHAMRRLTLQILCRVLFDADVTAISSEAATLIDLLLDEIDARVSRPRRGLGLVRPADVRLLFRVAKLERQLDKLISERRHEPLARADLLSQLAHSRDAAGRLLTSGRIRLVVVPLFFAGHETTAMALTWAQYLLAHHQREEAKVLEEIDSVLGGRRPGPADVAELAYLGNVFNETLRLYPPIWGFGRQAVQPTEIGPHSIAPGTVLWISQYVMSRDPRWFDAADDFIPERWEGGFARSLPRCAFIPFGVGSRRCLGGTFATWEAAVVLATILRRFELRPATTTRAVPNPSFTLRPRGGLRMRLRKRR
jgi:cytochrome P450